MSLVALRKVSKSFGPHHVLRDIDLEVHAGEILSIVGRSGSGKSTLLRCINGLETVDSGQIMVNGRPVIQEKRSLRQLHRDVGIVFQSFNLFPHLTVEENITLGLVRGKGISLSEARERAQRALASVRLSDKTGEYPSRLSGGQQQRAAIARAIAMEPILLLFDEITSALDPQLKNEVVRVLEELAAQNRTMILVTHEMAFARRSGNQLIFMHNGKIWEKGNPQDLFENPKTEEFRSFLSKVIR